MPHHVQFPSPQASLSCPIFKAWLWGLGPGRPQTPQAHSSPALVPTWKYSAKFKGLEGVPSPEWLCSLS